MTELPYHRTTNSKALLSMVLGIVTLALIPMLSLLVAPCGFPLALIAGISAVTLGKRGKQEMLANGDANGRMAAVGITTGWLGIVVNTLVMLLKLSMFVAMVALPIIAISHGIHHK